MKDKKCCLECPVNGECLKPCCGCSNNDNCEEIETLESEIEK